VISSARIIIIIITIVMRRTRNREVTVAMREAQQGAVQRVD
jgi:hypothetical protein